VVLREDSLQEIKHLRTLQLVELEKFPKGLHEERLKDSVIVQTFDELGDLKGIIFAGGNAANG